MLSHGVVKGMHSPAEYGTPSSSSPAVKASTYLSEGKLCLKSSVKCSPAQSMFMPRPEVPEL